MLLQATTVEAREALEQKTPWVTKEYKSAIVIRKSFPVMVHGMKISRFDENDQPTIRERIERGSKDLHPNLKVMKGRWSTSAWRPTVKGEKKRYSSLILDVATPEMADTLIRNGLINNNEAKIVERLDQSASLIQCYRCQEYGHMSTTYRNGIQCAECNQAHDTREHKIIAPAATKACASCGCRGHAAYDPACTQRIKERQRAAQSGQQSPIIQLPIENSGADLRLLNNTYEGYA